MPTFPAFEDQEPPARSRRQRLTRLGIVVGVLALAAAGGLAATAVRDGDGGDRLSAGESSATPSASASGDRTGPPDGILWYDSERLAVADPDGGRRQRISADFPTTQPRYQLSISPDRTKAITDDGYLVPLDRPGLVPAQRVLPADLAEGSVPPVAFGDQGRTVTVDLSTSAKPQVGVIDVATGRLRVVGAGTVPTGDPRSSGAAFATGIREIAGEDSDDVFLDTDRLERVSPDEFTGPTVLLRKADLLRLMALPTTTNAGFASIGFAPDGQHLYFTAVAASNDPGPYGPTGRWAVGILSRAGEVKAFKVLDKLHYPNTPVWSPAGDQLVFEDFADVSRLERARATLLLWTLGPSQVGAPTVLRPAEGLQPFSHGDCVWKPDGTVVLCGDDRAWYTIPLTGGTPSVAESVPGRPLAWVTP